MEIIKVYSYDSKEIDRDVLNCEDKDHIKVCKYCGKQFVATGRNYRRACVCKRNHYSYCFICNSKFSQDKAISNGSKLSGVCKNKECKNKFSGLRSKQAIRAKYGVDNPFQLESVKQKSKETCLRKYGVEHAIQNDEVKCKQKQSIQSISEDEKQEIVSRRKQTCLTKYGVDNPSKLERFRNKSKATCLERYGVEYASQSSQFRHSVDMTWDNKSDQEISDIIAKRIETTQELYGVDHACQNFDIKEKLINSLVDKSDEDKQDIRTRTMQTCLERYGGISPASSQDVQAKMRQTTLQRYGVECIFQNVDFQKQVKQRFLELYGVENPLQSEEIKEKRKQTCLDRYGVEHPMQTDEIRKRVSETKVQNYAKTIEDEESRNNYLSFMNDPIKYVTTHFDHMPTYSEIEHSIGNRCNCTIYDKIPTSLGLVDQSTTSMEFEVETMLKSIDKNIVIFKHNHTIIKPYELDLFLPEYNLAIECNPTYTHNSSLPSYSNIEPLDKNYHKMKTDLCENQGIFLFHIFGYEWNHRRDIIESMIRNLLKKNTVKFYARNLDIVELSSIECKSFLDANHRQKGVNCKVKLGLKTKSGELVSCMTFSKPRSTIGSINFKNTWELVRFCNKLNVSVIGGASKLFKHFLNHYSYDLIFSFSDRAHTKGGLYETLGFCKISQSNPSYMWVNILDDNYYNRVTCQKQNLKNLFKNDQIDIKNKTEKQIMMEHGYVQVFDSGTIRWEYL